MSRWDANEGEFLILESVPDYEHDGDCGSHIQFLKEEFEEAGVDYKGDGVRFSWFTDYDEDGEEGWVTIRGNKSLEEKYNKALRF